MGYRWANSSDGVLPAFQLDVCSGFTGYLKYHLDRYGAAGDRHNARWSDFFLTFILPSHLVVELNLDESRCLIHPTAKEPSQQHLRIALHACISTLYDRFQDVTA